VQLRKVPLDLGRNRPPAQNEEAQSCMRSAGQNTKPGSLDPRVNCRKSGLNASPTTSGVSMVALLSARCKGNFRPRKESPHGCITQYPATA